jgi:hypothetical protein
VQRCELCNEREADSCASGLIGSGPAVEDFEDRFTFLARHAGTAVVDGDHDAAVLGPDPHLDLRSRRCVTHGVHEQVVDDALDFGRVHDGVRKLGTERDRVHVVAMRRDY